MSQTKLPQLPKQENGLKHFAAKGHGPFVMLCAHFIDKLPAIIWAVGFVGLTWGVSKLWA